MLKRRIRLFLYKWHRRLGIAAALLVLILSISGILLNHTGSLALSKHFPQSAFWLWPYDKLKVSGFSTASGWIYEAGKDVWINDQRLSDCALPIVSVTEVNSEIWVLCDQQIVLLAEGKIVENIDLSLINFPIFALGKFQSDVVFNTPDGWFFFDLMMMEKGESVTESVNTSQPSLLPHELQKNRYISWERILLDLHSGRWFGAYGVWIIDAAAIILLLLACSGLWIWLSRNSNKSKNTLPQK